MQISRLSQLPQSAKGTLYVLVGAVCISFSPLFVRLPDVGPTAAAFYRLLWGSVALFAVSFARKDRILPSGRVLVPMLLAAAFFTGDLSCWHRSILYIGPGLATIIANFQVFLLALIGVFFLGERPGPRLALSIPLAFAGLWMLLEIDLGRDLPTHVLAGVALGFCTAAFYTGYILTLRRSQSLADRLPAVSNMAAISFMGTLFCALVATLQGESLAVPSLQSKLLLVVYGAGCQGLGWFLLSKGLPHLPASRAGLLMLTQPTLSFIWDVLLCGRPTGAVGYCGALLALFAISLGVTDKGGTKKQA
ncbi:DMT family transporter [Desulfovibrio sp. OttesenSCG-928-A18]|nr:DMT family transporter [Desulfovibrio sp. OttesenSCG-928-A18]